MKSNIKETPLRTYGQIPKSWPTRPNLINYNLADESIHIEDGWRDVVVPTLLPNERLGELFYSEMLDQITYRTERLTQSEIEQNLINQAEAERQETIRIEQEKLILSTANAIEDEGELIEKKALFPIWESLADSFEFRVNEKYQAIDADGLSLYRVIQAHRKQITWHPNVTPALWSKIVTSNGIEVWIQPIGGDGKYPYRDQNTSLPYRVSHKGFIWENNFQGGLNVWEPGSFGWTQISPV